MALVLAVGRIFTLGRIADRLGRQFAGHELVAASLTDDALARIGGRVPDVVVFPQSLFPTEKAALVAQLREWTDSEGHGQTPVAMRAPSVRGADGEWFYWFKSSDAKKLVVGGMTEPRRAAPPAPAATPPVPQPVPPAAPAMPPIQPAAPPPPLPVVEEPRASAPPIEPRDEGPSALQRFSESARVGAVRLAALGRIAAIGARSGSAVLATGLLRGTRSTGRGATLVARSLWTGATRVASAARSQASRIEMPSASTRKIALQATGAGAAAAIAITFGGGVVRQVGAIARVAAARRPAPAAAAAPSRPVTKANTGGLNIVSDPPGATVLIDGRERGLTPLAVSDLPAGQHVLALRHDSGSVRQTVRVKANEMADVDVPLFTGWVAVFAPFELRITDGGRVVALDEQSRAMLSPGTHELQLVNRVLGYHATQLVVVRPGQMTPISIVPPNTSATLTSNPPSEVWIDGTRVGQTPLQGIGVAIGTREFVFRNAETGERRVMKTVTTQPFRIDVDLTRSDQ